MSDLHRNAAYNIVPNPRQPTCPAAADPPGWKGGSPEGGEGGLLRVRRPRSLVPPQGAIKSTGAMRYSSLKKPERNPQSQTSIPYKKTKEISRQQVKQANRKSNQPNASESRKCRGAIGTSPDNKPTASQPSPTPVAKITRAFSPSSARPLPWWCCGRPRCRRPRRRRAPECGRTARRERPGPRPRR